MSVWSPELSGSMSESKILWKKCLTSSDIKVWEASTEIYSQSTQTFDWKTTGTLNSKICETCFFLILLNIFSCYFLSPFIVWYSEMSILSKSSFHIINFCFIFLYLDFSSCFYYYRPLYVVIETSIVFEISSSFLIIELSLPYMTSHRYCVITLHPYIILWFIFEIFCLLVCRSKSTY